MSEGNEEKRYREAVEARDAMLSSIGNEEFSQSNMDAMKALQLAVREAKDAMDSAAKQAEAASTSSETCTVTLIRGGKADRNVTVPVGTTMADLVHTLGWGGDPLTYKRRVGPGQTSEIADLAGTELQAGDHEIFVTPRVSGG